MGEVIKEKRGRGQPTKYKPDFHPEEFIKLSQQGMHIYEIARAWGVSRDSLNEWGRKHSAFSDAIKRGKEYAEAWYIEIGKSAMLGKQMVNVGMYVWLTKNLFKWKEKEDSDQSSGSMPEITLNYKLDEKKI